MAAELESSLPSSESTSDLIFLSYARADRARVEAVAAELRARGASVWFDPNLAAGGSAYVESLQHALGRAGTMLVFVSAASAGSPWVADEVRAYRSLMAREQGHKLLAVHLDKTRAPLALAGAGAVDARDARPEATASLIASALGGAGLAPAKPGEVTMPRLEAAARPAAPLAPQVVASVAPARITSGQVFVSYARTDRERVQPLIEELRARGATVWDDGGAAHGGGGWVESARGALERSQTLLVAVSAASAASAWVEDEVRAFQTLKARDASRSVIAVHMDQTPSPVSLSGSHAVDAQTLAPAAAAGLIAAALPEAAAPVVDATRGASEPAAAEAAVMEPSPGELAPEASARNGASMPEEAVAAAPAPVAEAAAPVEAAAPAPVAEAAAPVEAAAPAPVVEAAPAPEAAAPQAPVAALEKTSPIRHPAADLAESPVAAPAKVAARRNSAVEAIGLLFVLLVAIAIAAGMYALFGAGH